MRDIYARHRASKRLQAAVKYLFISVLAFMMVAPLLWLLLAAFKPSNEVFDTKHLWPQSFRFENFVNGWNSVKPYSYTRFYLNTLSIVLPTIVGNVFTTCTVSYGFARGRIKGKNILFFVLLGTMMMPSTTTMIPNYVIFSKLGWVNTYLPFIVPAFVGGSAFFVFLMVQFIKGLPRELDESAMIDGCNSFQIFSRIIMPNCIPTIVTVIIFTFMWSWDDFMGQLIYLSEVKKYTVALVLKLSVDPLAVVDWGAVLAMTLVSIIPVILVYFFAQDYFVEGISTTGLKG